MKRKEFNAEINKLSAAELNTKARALAEELMKLRFRKASGQLENSSRLGETRRNLARVKGILSKKRIEATKAA